MLLLFDGKVARKGMAAVVGCNIWALLVGRSISAATAAAAAAAGCAAKWIPIDEAAELIVLSNTRTTGTGQGNYRRGHI